MKTVLVTGAGTGIGLNTARIFLNNGWKVLAHYNSTDPELKKLQKKVSKKRIVLIQANLNNCNEIKKLINIIKDHSLSALVNNAGLPDLGYLNKKNEEKIYELFTVNSITPTFLAYEALKKMKEKKCGSIVNISSIATKYGSGIDNIFYGMSKGALEVMTKSMAKEGAKDNVLVNTIQAGVIDTQFHNSLKKNMATRKEMIPLKRLGKTDSVASLIYFLCSTNDFITGQVITISGGE